MKKSTRAPPRPPGPRFSVQELYDVAERRLPQRTETVRLALHAFTTLQGRLLQDAEAILVSERAGGLRLVVNNDKTQGAP
jgi:hypothetical protein